MLVDTQPPWRGTFSRDISRSKELRHAEWKMIEIRVTGLGAYP